MIWVINDKSDDSAELISQLDPSLPDTANYSAIAKVKQKDKSFDLTPLFVGSQGSLGIVCEAILRANFVHPEYSVVAAPFKMYRVLYHGFENKRFRCRIPCYRFYYAVFW